MQQRQHKISLFYSCHPSDDIVCDRLAQFLRPLVREGYVEQWTVQQVLPGDETSTERTQAFESATCIVLLLSVEYLTSEMYYQEMLSALERQKNGIHVIPILVRPALLEKELEASLPSCLPENGQPVSVWKKREEALFDVAQSISQILRLPLTTRRRRSSPRPSYRDYLLDQVFASWIEGFLEPSLQGRMPLDVPLEEDPDAIGNPETRINPWREEVQGLRWVPRPLLAGMNIIQAYDAAHGELLILGEPGTGKTIVLLELTRLLLKRAESDNAAPVPVVFPLSSWAKEKQALDIWFVEVLWKTFQIPQRTSKGWIDNNAILPLLDGLDEVAEPARAACVQAIELYRRERQRELVICCRRKEYLALPRRLSLQRAVSLQQLTENQVEHYIQQVEQSTNLSLQSLRQALHTDEELNALVHQPLMLNLFTLAYQGAEATDLLTKSTYEKKSRIIFSKFVEQMLARRGLYLRTGTPEELRQRLTFLASQMHREQETLLTLEYLQPEWLSGWPRRLYWWSVRLVMGLLGFLLFMLFFVLPALLSGRVILGDPSNILLLGLVFGLAAIVGAKGRVELPSTKLSWKFWRRDVRLEQSLYRAAWHANRQKIRPAEVILWSWKKGLKGGIIGGLCSSLVFAFNTLLFAVHFQIMLLGFIWLFVGGFFGLIGGLYSGITLDQLSERNSLSPNQGMWRSGRNGLVAGLFGGLAVGLFIATPFGIFGGQQDEFFRGLIAWLIFGWLFALLFGLIFGLLTGINAFIQHFVLRFWLWHTQSLPWNLNPFLDEATERLLLRKVGGSFMFIHRALQDYFADSETEFFLKDKM